MGGHLETATVYTTIELLLAEIQKSNVVKHKDRTSGGMQIKLPIGDK
jgi:predicted DNA-binding protein with PD1-like motif